MITKRRILLLRVLRKLAGDLFNAFTWDDTEEGQRYWENVSNKLKRIAKEGF